MASCSRKLFSDPRETRSVPPHTEEKQFGEGSEELREAILKIYIAAINPGLDNQTVLKGFNAHLRSSRENQTVQALSEAIDRLIPNRSPNKALIGKIERLSREILIATGGLPSPSPTNGGRRTPAFLEETTS